MVWIAREEGRGNDEDDVGATTITTSAGGADTPSFAMKLRRMGTGLVTPGTGWMDGSVPGLWLGRLLQGRGADGLLCHRPRAAPVGSMMMLNQPMLGTSWVSFMILAPRDLALALAALMSSTRT